MIMPFFVSSSRLGTNVFYSLPKLIVRNTADIQKYTILLLPILVLNLVRWIRLILCKIELSLVYMDIKS